jgi:hypothetical protein
MKKLLFTLTTLYFLLGQSCIAQRKPFVFTPDKMTHYFSIGVGFPLPTFIGYEYRLNEWSYGAEIGVIHTSILANLRKSTNTNPKNIYVRDNLKSGMNYSASLKYHFSEKTNSFYVGSQLRLLKIGLHEDTPRAMISVFAPDRMTEIENKLNNNRILNKLFGGKNFLDETDMQPNVILILIGVSMGKNMKLAKKIIFEPKLSIDFKLNQHAKLDFDSDSPRIDKILGNQISPYVTKSIKNQNLMNFLPSLSFAFKYEFFSK